MLDLVIATLAGRIQLLRDQHGQALVEYALIVALVAIGATIALTSIGGSVAARLAQVATDI